MALFTKTLKNNSGRIAIISDAQESFTYEWLLEKSDLFAREINVSKSLIFILSSNSVSSLVGYISSIENGHLALMIDNKINQILLNNLIENYKPNFLWVPSNISNLFPNNEIVFQFMNYDLILISENQVDFNPKLKLLLTTSGSTGSPKLVRLSEENLLSNAKSIIQYLNINESEKPVTLLPMHYSYGLSIINSHLLTGATILLTDKSIFQKELWELIKTHKATSISGVPFTYQMLKKLRIFRMDLPYLKTFTQAGGRLAKDIILDFVEYCEKANKRFITMYGQTEATARMSYLPFEKSRSKAGSIGIPIPGGHFKIINEHGDGVDEANVEGELVYFGRNVCLGYAEKINDLLLEDINNHSLYTGDLAIRDEDGYYYITGRKNRFIKYHGNRINLDELEKLLENEFSNCAVIGEEDLIKIFTTKANLNNEIKIKFNLITGLNPSSLNVVLINEIPLNSSGKISYNDLIKYETDSEFK